MPSHPVDFFTNFVKRAYDEWKASPLDEYRAKIAVQQADVMAERMWKYWRTRDPAKVSGAQSAQQYREHLTKNECPDFGLVWDAHDAHKHVELDRKGRRVTSSDQTGTQSLGFGEGAFGEGPFSGGTQLVVTTDAGQERELSLILGNVTEMWQRLLA